MGLQAMRCMKLLVQLGSAATLLLLVTWAATSRPATPTPTPAPIDPGDAYQDGMKTILFWNRFFDAPHFGQRVGHRMFADYACAEQRCFVADHQDGATLPLGVDEFDMVVFHGLDLDSHRVPAARKQHQRYVFFLHESPATFPLRLRPWNGFFNLTATYRRDSDIFMPYGWLVPRGAPRSAGPEREPRWLPPPDASTPSEDTPRLPRLLAAWLASNCVNAPSNRDELVRELAQHAPVHVLGRCGRACVDDECDRDALAARYQFYLALENSLCRDYVTEKLFEALDSDLVPVVLGGADYSKVAPPGSYVDAADFATPKELAEHLLQLDADPEAYERHFWWKRHYEVRQGTDHVMCQMCALLHNASLAPSSVADLHGWWHDAACALPAARLATWLLRARDTPAQLVEHAFVTLARQDVSAWAFVGVLAVVVLYLGVVVGIKWRHATVGEAKRYRLMEEVAEA